MDLNKTKLKRGEKENMKTKIKQESGITLIALVVTIVVLLILAGVTINAVFSDSGIIKKAQNAQNRMNEAQQSDLNAINEVENWINENIPTDKKLITFTFDGKTYKAEEKMTVGEFISSSYYVDGPLPSTRKCSKCGGIMQLSGDSLQYIGSNSRVNFESNIPLNVTIGNGAASSRVNKVSILQDGIIISAIENCSD